jgi:hypothetical protein
VSWKDRKAILPAIKAIYRAENADMAMARLGIPISADTVRTELVKLGFPRQSNRKADEGPPQRTRAPMLHARETDCMAGHIGLELRCAERKFISLTCRAVSDSGASAETIAVPWENDLLC